MLDALMHQELSIANLQLLWGEWCKNLIPKLYVLIGIHNSHKQDCMLGYGSCFVYCILIDFWLVDTFGKVIHYFESSGNVILCWHLGCQRCDGCNIPPFCFSSKFANSSCRNINQITFACIQTSLNNPLKLKHTLCYITQYVGLTFHNMNTHKPRSPHPLQKHSTLWRAL